MAVPIVPVVLTGIGAYLTWFGVHYWGSDTKWPTDPVKDVLRGKPIRPPTGQVTAAQVAANAGQGTPATTTAVVTGSGSPIAGDALQYAGQGYTWGGPADKPGNWDCSSFVSYVLGHDLRMGLPGGNWGDPGFPPHAHGPTTLNYMLFGTGIDYGREQPGDLVVSTEHMGIVIGGGKMISAQDPQLGTGIGSYRGGFPGGQPLVRRVAASGGVMA